MCALCGVLGGSGHWTDAAARPGVFTRNRDGLQRRRERAHRIACASGVLKFYGLTLSDWQASSFVLSTATGKTELLQRLLGDPALADTAVLINEFGEVGLDHHLLERIDDTMVLLQSGCLCCTIRSELSAAIRDLHSKRERGTVPRFRRLVVESTGLADPFPILSTVQADPVLRHHFRLGNVITTVDAVNGTTQLARQPECTKQVAVADRLVLTKTDLADRPPTE